jgi:hypothetical protein
MVCMRGERGLNLETTDGDTKTQASTSIMLALTGRFRRTWNGRIHGHNVSMRDHWIAAGQSRFRRGLESNLLHFAKDGRGDGAGSSFNAVLPANHLEMLDSSEVIAGKGIVDIMLSCLQGLSEDGVEVTVKRYKERRRIGLQRALSLIHTRRFSRDHIVVGTREGDKGKREEESMKNLHHGQSAQGRARRREPRNCECTLRCR